MTVYVESSAAGKLLIEEPESPALSDYLDDIAAQARVVSSLLVETELRRLAVRIDLDQIEVTAVLARFWFVDLDPACYRQAGLLPGANLRSLDAIHIAAALSSGVDAMVTYDRRQADAARAVGLAVIAPS